MNIHEEIFLIANLINASDSEGNVDIENENIWKSLLLSVDTKIHHDYFFELDNKGIIYYEEIGEESFPIIILCSIKNETKEYFKQLIIQQQDQKIELKKEIENLSTRINEILTFDPNKLSNEIKKSQTNIDSIKNQIISNPLLRPLEPQLEEIDKNLKSVIKVTEDYEEVYKNIILPVKKEGEAGIKQTVKWAIISIIISSIISGLISWLMK